MPYSTIEELPDFDLEFEDDYIDECLHDEAVQDDPYNDHNAPVYWLH